MCITRKPLWFMSQRMIEFEFSNPPSPLEGLKIGYALMFADGGASIVEPLRTFETLGPAIRTVRWLLQLPLFVKRLYAWALRTFSRPYGRNEVWASLLEGFHAKSASEVCGLVVRRDEYRAAWFEAMREQRLDFVLTLPHALPAMPKGQFVRTACCKCISCSF